MTTIRQAVSVCPLPGTDLGARVGAALRFLCAVVGSGILWLHLSLLFFAFSMSQFADGPTVVLTSGSMAPTLSVGDVLIAERPRPEHLQAGRVAVFSQDERLITHRLIRQATDDIVSTQAGSEVDWWITKGDANRLQDTTPVHSTSIRGVGRVVVPFVGLPRMWLEDNRWGVLALWATTLTCAFGTVCAFLWPSNLARVAS